MLYQYSFASVHKLYLKKAIMSYFFSLFNFVLLYYSFMFLFRMFVLKSKKISYLFFLFNIFFKNQKWLFFFFFLLKKCLLFSFKKLLNKESIYFFFSSINKKTGLLSLLRSFFIYKKSFEQFGISKQKYNLFFHSFFFFPFFKYQNYLETVITVKHHINLKTLNIYIK